MLGDLGGLIVAAARHVRVQPHGLPLPFVCSSRFFCQWVNPRIPVPESSTVTPGVAPCCGAQEATNSDAKPFLAQGLALFRQEVNSSSES